MPGRDMTFGKKLGICVGASFALSVSLGVTASVYLTQLRNEVNRAVADGARKAEIINDIRYNILMSRFGERGILLFTAANGPAKVEASKQAFAKASALVLDKAGEMKTLAETDRVRQLLDEVMSGLEDYRRIQAQIPQLCATGHLEEALKIDMEQLVPPGTRASNAAEELVKVQADLNNAAITTAENLLVRGRIVIAVILVLVVGLGIIALMVMLRGTRVLKSTAGRLLASSDRIRAAAGQVSSASHMLAQGASKQAASIEETSSSAQEVAAVANQNADTAADTERLMGDAEKVAVESNAALTGMEEAMKRIDGSTSNISRIIRVIDEIAFQTNILALNAAVEAARAGEAGMGFAVVADEVRSLAQRSAQAAKETGGMIEECVDSARDGQKRIAEVKRTFSQNGTIQGTVKQHSGEIVAASREQARGADQIARAVQELGQLAETTAAQAEQSAASGRELSDESGNLHLIVEELEAALGH